MPQEALEPRTCAVELYCLVQLGTATVACSTPQWAPSLVNCYRSMILPPRSPSLNLFQFTNLAGRERERESFGAETRGHAVIPRGDSTAVTRLLRTHSSARCLPCLAGLRLANSRGEVLNADSPRFLSPFWSFKEIEIAIEIDRNR